MNGLQVFENNEFGEIRTLSINGEPWFVGKDVAEILLYANPSEAINEHTREKQRKTLTFKAYRETLPALWSGNDFSNKILINEPGLYRLIMSSKLPQAEQFQDWVCNEVLPSIRKTGGYIAEKRDETPEELMARALMIAQETLKRKEQRLLEAEAKVEELKPKALFADAVETSQRSCLVAELAKILKQNGVDTGQNRLFKWLRENGYLGNKGEYYNQPTQKAMDMGLFELKKRTVNNPDGTVMVVTTTKVTPKGQIYFVNKLIEK